MEAIVEEMRRQVQRNRDRRNRLYHEIGIVAVLIMFGLALWGIFTEITVKVETSAYQTVIEKETENWYNVRIKRLEKRIEEMQKGRQAGTASWYNYSLKGYPDYGKYNLTAASRKFPRGSILQVTNLENGKSVKVRVNDWIAHPDRIIDLSFYAFSQIENLDKGLVPVEIIKIN